MLTRPRITFLYPTPQGLLLRRPSVFAAQYFPSSLLPLRASYYDKELFDSIAKNISANFTRFDTEQLLKVCSARAQPADCIPCRCGVLAECSFE